MTAKEAREIAIYQRNNALNNAKEYYKKNRILFKVVKVYIKEIEARINREILSGQLNTLYFINKTEMLLLAESMYRRNLNVLTCDLIDIYSVFNGIADYFYNKGYSCIIKDSCIEISWE